MMKIWWVTTFPDAAWDVYAQPVMESLVRFLPPGQPLCVGLDTPHLLPELGRLRRTGDKIVSGWEAEHQAFVTRNRARDHATDYRLQATRFCHKIFMLTRFFQEALQSASMPDYLIWWDADAQLTRAPEAGDFEKILPRANEACSYLGRKDWDHSECGFMAFNMRHEGAAAILRFMRDYYMQDLVFSLPQWHDSYLFDVARQEQPCRNISEGVPGNNVWAGTALAGFSEHWKGAEAKKRRKPLTDSELFGR